MVIRRVRPEERDALLAIVNAAAEGYRGVIPADRWREPYMPRAELEAEIADGVEFWGAEQDGRLLGVMGIQDRGDAALVRHAYVAPDAQRKGVGHALLRHVRGLWRKPVLVGTWAAAEWAVAFYRRNGFALVPQARKAALLRKYWSIPERQIETSVVLEAVLRPGRCFCGALRYLMRGEPLTLYACHCGDCQKRSGSAFGLSMWVGRDALEITHGEAVLRQTARGDGRPCNNRVCAACGTQLWTESARNPEIVIMWPGTLDDTSWLRPVAHLWTRSAQPWFEFPPGAARYETQPQDWRELIELWREARR